MTLNPELDEAQLELEQAQKARIEWRDMLAVWILEQKRQGRKEVRFDDPHAAVLMKLCTDAEEKVIEAAARIVRESKRL